MLLVYISPEKGSMAEQNVEMKRESRSEKYFFYHSILFKIGGLLLLYNKQYPNVVRTCRPTVILFYLLKTLIKPISPSAIK